MDGVLGELDDAKARKPILGVSRWIEKEKKGTYVKEEYETRNKYM